MNSATLFSFGLYLLLTLAVGLYAYIRTRDLGDYILGGRRLGVAVTAISAGASDMSGWLLLGLPGAILVGGLGEIWMVIGLFIGAYLSWRLVATPLRRATAELAALTLPDYFAARFTEIPQLLRIVSALLILFFFALYAGAGLVAGALLFEQAFGLDYHHGLWIATAAVVAYTVIGGFLAVAWTDFVQGLLMLGALIVVPTVALIELSNSGGLSTSLNARPELIDPLHGVSLIGALSLLSWGLGYFGQPHILVRFMAIERVERLTRARHIALGWMLICLIGATATGLVGALYVDAPLEKPESIFIQLTTLLFHPWIAGVLLAAILAAIMSTIDSQLLVSSSALVEDLYRPIAQSNVTASRLVWIGRLAVVVIALIAMALAWDPKSRVLDLVSYAWAGFGATFGPIILFALLWSRSNGYGALAGMLVGSSVTVVWHQLEGGLFNLYELLPAFLMASIAIAGVSSLTPHTREQG